jgi:hypothetical protein
MSRTRTGARPMAHFRGTVKGARSEASRLGHKGTGITVVAQSWDGEIAVELWHDAAKGCDRFSVLLRPNGASGGVRLASGSIRETIDSALSLSRVS